MTQTMPEKLELIARCIREGREVEYNCGEGWVEYKCVAAIQVTVLPDNEYRAKPDKPRKGQLYVTDEHDYIGPGVLLTPEVRQVLEDAGLI